MCMRLYSEPVVEHIFTRFPAENWANWADKWEGSRKSRLGCVCCKQSWQRLCINDGTVPVCKCPIVFTERCTYAALACRKKPQKRKKIQSHTDAQSQHSQLCVTTAAVCACVRLPAGSPELPAICDVLAGTLSERTQVQCQICDSQLTTLANKTMKILPHLSPVRHSAVPTNVCLGQWRPLLLALKVKQIRSDGAQMPAWCLIQK